MIAMNEVSKIYETRNRLGWFRAERVKTEAVKSLSLTLEPGQITGLLGLNGAGKTTTIRMLSTLLDPTEGSIEVDGLDMNRSRSAIQQKVNMIAGGERMLYWRLTGRENLHYFGSLYGLDSARLRRESDRLLSEVGLAEAADRPVEQYSKGMKQRLQIARGLINDPKYLFLDEPTLGLDAPIARQLRGMVRSLAKERGKGILLTSHYLQEVEELCDNVYVLNRGELLMCDTPDRIVAKVAGMQAAHFELTGWRDELNPLLLEYLQAEIGLNRKEWTELHRPTSESGSSSDEPIRLTVKSRSADKLIAKLLPWTAENGLKVVSFSAEKPNLEDAIILLSEGKVS
ncbi:ABC-2 type transport system ATP-binding protein [Paenibacillus forsythiae]|uniref:ABC-2 type transport system ATP-binding protein n=1 Tax=Paenibacillus forsythiae TaxID=365616 RepID=A0ABU3H1D1_9BACL|nr:ABC transporter ATP-binding protein [Paenibacillus forsythiae]MDT3424618.1 ABC-2 type transport system ATP-binding protein [Paenibacillus forsythiae]